MTPEQKFEVAEYLIELEALLKQAASPNSSELTEHDLCWSRVGAKNYRTSDLLGKLGNDDVGLR